MKAAVTAGAARPHPTYGEAGYPDRLRHLSRNCIQAQDILELQHGLPYENVVRGLLRTLESELNGLGDALEGKAAKSQEQLQTEWRELLQLHRRAVMQADADLSDLFERRLAEFRESLLTQGVEAGPLSKDAILDFAAMHGIISSRRHKSEWSEKFNTSLVGFAASVVAAHQRAAEPSEAHVTAALEAFGNLEVDNRINRERMRSALMATSPETGRVVSQTASYPLSQEPIAWVHESESSRTISAEQKAGMLRDGGAGATSVRPYSVPAFAGADARANAAVATLSFLGYTYHGGVQWKPPIGKPPVFSETSSGEESDDASA